MSNFVNLADHISVAGAECLNEDPSHPICNLFQPNKDLVLKSDESVDHQLLVRIPFNTTVKLGGIKIYAPDTDEAPQVLKIFQNKFAIGFSDAEADTPEQTITLDKENLNSEEPIPLRFVKFQNVQSIQLFFEDNHGGDVTVLQHIEIFGQTGESMDMANFKPVKG